jgi:hypothetical protein
MGCLPHGRFQDSKVLAGSSHRDNHFPLGLALPKLMVQIAEFHPEGGGFQIKFASP